MSILRTLIRKQTVLSVGRRLCHGYREPASEFDSSGSSSDTRAEVRRARSVTSQTCAEAYCKCLAASQPCYEAPAPSLVRHAKAAVGDRVWRPLTPEFVTKMQPVDTPEDSPVTLRMKYLLMFTYEIDLLKIYVVSTSKASDAESPFSGYEESMSSNRLSFIFQVVGFFFQKIQLICLKYV